MSEQFICDKAGECTNPLCDHNEPHDPIENKVKCCGHGGFNHCIVGSVCVPVASLEAAATKSHVATERGTSDPDAVLARGYALIHQTRVWLSDEEFSVGELLLRLADKVEGKNK